MSHLGGWLSALVDGELDGTERDRVLNHIAACAACRQEANAMRALKRRLTALGDACGEAPIASRLIELARGDWTPAGGVYSTVPWSAAAVPAQRGGGTRHVRLGWKIATGTATSALLAIGAIAFLLGNASGEPPVPKITPSVDSFLLQHSRDAGQEPAGAPSAGVAASAGSQAGGGSFWLNLVTPVMLDPHRPGTARLGQLAAPVHVAGGTTGPGPVASATASPAPATSASGSPVASVPASPRHSAYPHPASRSSK
ncbi:MAG TPA: zf-HC2 domain-containing protein [Streptosporangiaceae bacterium]|nr:zf-HC2 domain-containing protein [Streptosporangiaceae bacterium]